MSFIRFVTTLLVVAIVGTVVPLSDQSFTSLVTNDQSASVELAPTAHAANIAVVPGARGFGINTPAGRGGKIIRVTNLNDSGPGSLRAALEASGKRTVIFDVSGEIKLGKKITVKNPYLTVAGQTAPSPGITIRRAGITIQTHDVLLQHFRVRVGNETGGPNLEDRDGLQVISKQGGSSNVYNVVIDHMSISWAVDENISTWYPGVRNVTLRDSITSEALFEGGHPKGPHSMGFLIGNESQSITVDRNLFANNMDRNPRIGLNLRGVEVINNLVYNWKWSGTDVTKNSSAAVIGNKYIAGPDTNQKNGIEMGGQGSINALYVKDNLGVKRTNSSQPEWTEVSGGSAAQNQASSPTFGLSGVNPMSATQVENYVLQNAGARPADRDAVDRRVTAGVKNRTGRLINNPGQVGGWPNLAKNTRKLETPGNPNGDDDNDGYTNLEEWLHDLACDVGDSDSCGDKDPVELPPVEDNYVPGDYSSDGGSSSGGSTPFTGDRGGSADDYANWQNSENTSNYNPDNQKPVSEATDTGRFTNVPITGPVLSGGSGDGDPLTRLIVAILNALVIIMTPIIVLAIIYSGFLYVTARGNADQIRKANTAIVYAIIGGVLILSSVVLTSALGGAASEFLAE